MNIKTERTVLEILPPEDASLMVEYYQRNKEHLSLWEPVRKAKFYTEQYWKKQLVHHAALAVRKEAFMLTALTPDRLEVIGVCNFNNIVWGAFEACHMGYSIAGKYEGKGYMFEIAEAGINAMFTTVGLHRVMANYIPDNLRSAALLKRLGFEQEGLAKKYLRINRKWHDHILTSKISTLDTNLLSFVCNLLDK